MKHSTMISLLVSGLCMVVVLLALPEVISQPPAPPNSDIMSTESRLEPFDTQVYLQVITETGIEEMTLREYLIGVVQAEVPQSFPTEAIKAQTIAARTFTLRQKERGKHTEGDVCTDAACCQAWKHPDGAAEKYVHSVEETDGLVITYEDKLIDATYFSGSGGKTEAAVEVWGSDIPYLQAVDSPGESTPYDEVRCYLPEEFSGIITEAKPEAILDGSVEGWFGAVTHTQGGGIASMEIGGVSFSGVELRRLFSLRSTAFTVEATAGEIRISTRGYGHRVGLSQYGAAAMAERGADCTEILLHYYQGTVLQRLEQSNGTR